MESGKWLFGDVIFILDSAAKIRNNLYYPCAKKGLSVLQRYDIANDILQNQEFTAVQLATAKELIRVKLKIPKQDQELILAEIPDPTDQPAKQDQSNTSPASASESHDQENTQEKCGLFLTYHVKEKDGEQQIIYHNKAHSKVADILAEIFDEELAFDQIRQDWSYFSGSAWLPVDPGQADYKFSKIFREETLPTGYSKSSYQGSIEVLSKSGLLQIPSSIPDVIPFLNGLLYYKTGDFVNITAANAQEWVLPYSYQETSGCPNFLAWLKGRFPGENGRSIIKFIQAFFNATVTGKSYHDIFLHLKGIEGSGKSTLTRVLTHLLGDRAVISSTIRKLNEGRFELAKLYGDGKKLLIIPEVKKFNDMTMLNAITGRDPLSFEDKGLSVRVKPDFIWRGQTILTSNPALEMSSAQAGAVARRRRTVECDLKITPEERIEFNRRGGEQKLYDEAPGIVSWLLELTDDEVDELLINPPNAIKTANRKAELSGNGLAMWISECLEYNPHAYTGIGTGRPRTERGRTYFGSDDAEQVRLYPNYLKWCAENTISKLEQIDTKSFAVDLCNTASRIFETTDIYRELNDKGDYKRRNIGFCIMGLKIKQVVDDEYYGEKE